jgi:ferrochelatase
MTNSESIAVVLFNLGGPENLSAVEPFLVKLFSDREIIELPGGAAMQPLMARIIAKLRGPSVRANYTLIGGGSPQLRITRAQASALEARLNAATGGCPRFHVFISMRYSDPEAHETLALIAAEDTRHIVTLSLFPHWSKATTGSSRNAFDRALREPRWKNVPFDISHIDSYPDDPGYLDAMTDTVRAALRRIPGERRDGTVILFSAHGLPQKFVDEGDPYVEHIQATRQGILARLAVPNRQLLAYQSRTGPVKWLGPGTEEMIEALGHEGVKDLLVVPLSFVSDHIETMYEVDILFAETARKAGITGYFRPESLNTHPMFIDALARLVLDKVGGGVTAPELEHAGAA